jgi:hypothetical protein
VLDRWPLVEFWCCPKYLAQDVGFEVNAVIQIQLDLHFRDERQTSRMSREQILRPF